MHRRVGAQLLVGLASYPQSMLPTDPVVSLHEYTLLLGTGNARTCRIPGDVLWPKERVRFCMMVVARCSWRRCWHPGRARVRRHGAGIYSRQRNAPHA